MIKRETGSRTTHAIEPLTINRNVRSGRRSEAKDVVVRLRCTPTRASININDVSPFLFPTGN